MDSLDFSQLYCRIHPYELINNFCNDERCLVGLCATCVCQHTDMHSRNATVPQYQNIRDTYTSLNDEVRSQIVSLQNYQQRLTRLKDSVDMKKITIKKNIRELREKTIDTVMHEFDCLEKKIISDISNEGKKLGFHSQLQFDSIQKGLNKQIDIVLNSIQTLNSKSFLERAKYLKKEGLQHTQLSKLRLEKQINDNETFTTNLRWNQNFRAEISNSLKKLFSLEFVVPKGLQNERWMTTYLHDSNSFTVQPRNLGILSNSASNGNFGRNTSEIYKGSMTSSSGFYPRTSQNNSLVKHSFIRREDSLPHNLNSCSESRVFNNQKQNYGEYVINRSNLIHRLGNGSNSTYRSSKAKVN